MNENSLKYVDIWKTEQSKFMNVSFQKVPNENKHWFFKKKLSGHLWLFVELEPVGRVGGEATPLHFTHELLFWRMDVTVGQ